MDPCTNCKRTSCPKVCYPKRDYIRSQRKQPQQMCVYMVVTVDKYRLPMAVADSVEELAKMIGVSEQSIMRQLSRIRKRRVHKSRYEMVFVDKEDWEDLL